MFNRPKQKKLDSKIRFQHRTFTQKVREAKEYKREAKRLPETDKERFFASVGLDSWWSRTLVVVGIVGLLYLVYVPNFLFVKKITVTGAEGDDRVRVEKVIEEYFASRPLYIPQRNSIFLNADALKSYLLQYDPSVWHVWEVKKDLGSLSVKVELKRERFLMDTSTDRFILYNEGTVARMVSADEQTAPQLVRIQTLSQSTGRIGERYLHDTVAAAIDLVQDRFQNLTKIPVEYYELPITQTAAADEDLAEPTPKTGPLAVLVPNEFVLHTKKSDIDKNIPNFAILFDSSSDMHKALTDVAALLTQMDPARLHNLYYVDMRFSDRSFVCLQRAPCAQPRVETKPLDTSTDQSTSSTN